MRTTLFSIVLSLLVTSLFAQDKSFDLSKYKTPFYKRQELTTSFDLSGHKNGYTTDLYQNGDITQSTDYSTSDFASNINLNYHYIFNSRKKIIEVNSELAPEYQYQSNKQGTDQTKTNYFEMNFNFNGQANYYLTEDRFFLLLEPSFQMHPTYQKTESSSSYKDKSNYYDASFGIGAGLGRIEPVSDLWQSYYILKKLETKGLLNRNLTDDDIFEFAKTATQLKNKRFFDFRLRKISELETLDSLTHKQGLISDNSVGYITTLNDYWNFATIPDRYAGRELKLIVTPEYWESISQTNDEAKDKSHGTRLRPSINFRCHKPQNLYWDRIVHINLTENMILDQPNEEIPSNYLLTNASIGWNYYPNFRTTAGVYLYYSGQESPKQQENDYKKFWRNRFGVGGNLTYYISPQLQISSHISCYYNHKDESYNLTQKNEIQLSYNLSLSYAIF